jgi:cohesin complex subunit SCC1
MPLSLQLPSREALTLPDKVTLYDEFELPPPPDANWLLPHVEDVARGRTGKTCFPSNRPLGQRLPRCSLSA